MTSLNKEIVDDGEVEDSNIEMAYSDAIKIEPDFEIGEEVSQEVKVEDFGRRNILSLRQNLASKVMELEKDSIYQKYKERVGDIVNGEVYQIWKREILILDDDGNMKVATTNGSRSSSDEAMPTIMRMRQRGWDDASTGAKMTEEEPNNKQPQRQK